MHLDKLEPCKCYGQFCIIQVRRCGIICMTRPYQEVTAL